MSHLSTYTSPEQIDLQKARAALYHHGWAAARKALRMQQSTLSNTVFGHRANQTNIKRVNAWLDTLTDVPPMPETIYVDCVESEDGRSWEFLEECRQCGDKKHHHGAGPGSRVAHCCDPAQHHVQGYVLRLAKTNKPLTEGQHIHRAHEAFLTAMGCNYRRTDRKHAIAYLTDTKHVYFQVDHVSGYPKIWRLLWVSGDKKVEVSCSTRTLHRMATWLAQFILANELGQPYPKPPTPMCYRLEQFGAGCSYMWTAEAWNSIYNSHPSN